MLAKFRSQLSYSRVVATLALFVALGGSSFAAPARDAASKLISGKRIKNNSIASADIKNNSIKSGDVKNRSLLAKDFKAGQLPAGAVGPRGPVGSVGRLTYVRTDTALDPGDTDLVRSRCPVGQYVTGGSVAVGPYNAGYSQEQPDYDEGEPRSGWSAAAGVDGSESNPVTFTVTALCASGPPPDKIALVGP
jgi:hypothetical protein